MKEHLSEASVCVSLFWKAFLHLPSIHILGPVVPAATFGPSLDQVLPFEFLASSIFMDLALFSKLLASIFSFWAQLRVRASGVKFRVSEANAPLNTFLKQAFE